MFWTNFVRLCAENGVSPNKVAAECGVKSTGTVSGWKKGAMPSNKTLSKLANRFNISVEILVKEDALETLEKLKQEGKFPFGPLTNENKPATHEGRELTEKQLRMWNLIKDMDEQHLEGMEIVARMNSTSLDSFIATAKAFLPKE